MIYGLTYTNILSHFISALYFYQSLWKNSLYLIEFILKQTFFFYSHLLNIFFFCKYLNFCIFFQGLIYQEFFSQGDLEKALGHKPIEMMDRERAKIPDQQISFLDNIALPVF